MVGSIKAGVMSNPMFIKRPRNVRNPKGVRIRAALRAAAGLLLFFLLLRSDVLPLWGQLWGLALFFFGLAWLLIKLRAAQGPHPRHNDRP